MNKEAVLQYLQYHGDVDKKTEQFIEECIQEVKKIAEFKVVSDIYHLTHFPLTIEELDLSLDSEDLAFYFQDINQCLVVACTLGIQIDRRIKYYEHIDMVKAVVFDAVSNRYLEECCDAYEESLQLGAHTFRFAPGYGDLPLRLNIPLSQALMVHKRIGLTINKGGLFLPMKSMLGIIGIGKNIRKTCLSCIRKESCVLRKGGQRCYVID